MVKFIVHTELTKIFENLMNEESRKNAEIEAIKMEKKLA
jgi:hypothetical protein